MKLFPCFAALLVKIALTHLAKANGSSDCKLICDAKDFSRQVCGSDGETYQSKCVLRLKKCTSGRKLFVAYNGACRAPPSCTEERKRVFKSIRERHLLRVGIFIPECEADGSYSEIQCSQNKRVCWCVDKYGAEVDDTRVISKKPDCRYRRSNPYPSNERITRILKGAYYELMKEGCIHAGSRANNCGFFQGCSKDNRVSFNKKVMASFKKEMAKLSGTKGKLNSKGIADWKMSELDADNNDLLNHKELRTLIKRFKKVYLPRKCGKTFFFHCDENQDLFISKTEWLKCLGIQETQDSQDSPQCFNQQKRAKEEQKKSPSTTVFVPSCNKDGTYKTVQCEEVSRYCWCVHSVTGRNIPNTSVQNAKPDCTKPSQRVKPSTSLPDLRSIRKLTSEKPLEQTKVVKPVRDVESEKTDKKKECDDATWQRFRDELVKMVRKELQVLTKARLGGNTTNHGLRAPNFFLDVSPYLTDTMITAWKFTQLDVDKDRLIRDDELFSSHMKKMFGLIRRGRKCSKKLAVLCDFDHNGGLSLEEWRKCLGRRTTLKGLPGR